MAPKKRAPRDMDITSKVLPSVETDGEPASLLPDNIETDRPRRYMSWTPTPREEEEFMTWARKHFGERYFELREARRREKNHLKDPLKYYDMLQEMSRIDRRKTLAHEKEKKAALGDEYIPDRFVPLDETDSDNASPPHDDTDNNNNLKEGKTWQELMAWARMHYGEAWYEQREALDREEREEREAIDPDERKKKFLKTVKRDRILRQIELQRDEGMLAEGKTWHEIMAWPAKHSNILSSVETGGDIVSSPSSSSEHSDGSGYSTYPPTPTEARRQAMDGPQGPDHRWEWRWEQLEWDTVRSRMSEAQYAEERVRIADGIKSRRKDEERKRRLDAELAAMNDLKWKDPGRYYIEKEKRERQERDLDLRQKGWTQEQIEAADRADVALREWRERNPPPREPFLGQAIGQEEGDAHDAWLQKERAARLRIYGELPPSGSGPLGQHTTQKEKDAYDAWRRNIHARVSGQHEQEPGANVTADASATEKGSRLRAPTPQAKNTSHKTRGGRITKSTAQIQSVANRGTRSRRDALTPAEASMPDHGSKQLRRAPDKPGDNTAQVPPKTRKRQPKIHKERASDAIEDKVLQSKHHITRQRKVYKKERASQRLAERSVAPLLHEPPLRDPSNASKPNSSSPRNRAPSKKSIAVKGAKPQGISKSGHVETNRSKRSKQPGG